MSDFTEEMSDVFDKGRSHGELDYEWKLLKWIEQKFRILLDGVSTDQQWCEWPTLEHCLWIRNLMLCDMATAEELAGDCSEWQEYYEEVWEEYAYGFDDDDTPLVPGHCVIALVKMIAADIFAASKNPDV